MVLSDLQVEVAFLTRSLLLRKYNDRLNNETTVIDPPPLNKDLFVNLDNKKLELLFKWCQLIAAHHSLQVKNNHYSFRTQFNFQKKMAFVNLIIYELLLEKTASVWRLTDFWKFSPSGFSVRVGRL